MPFSVIEHEFLDIMLLVERGEKKGLEKGIVEDDHGGVHERAPVNFTVKLIVAQMVEPDIGAPGVHFHGPMAAERRHERGRVIRNTRAHGGKRRIEANRHGFLPFPNSAVPRRIKCAPSSIATAKSCDIPSERSGSPYCEPSSRRRRQ